MPISTELISMLSPARPCSADGDDASDLARVRGDGDDDRGEPPRSKRARTQERRAMQACFRCRKQKLRCLGGRPCVRCVKANKECDFGKGNAGNIAHPPNVTFGTAQQHEQQHQQERRAMQACFRCRKQKLRCLGGRPCVRCVKAKKECDFGKPGQASAAPNSSTTTNGKVVEDGDGVAARARLEYLESRVANPLAGLHEPGASGTDLLPAPTAAPARTPATAPSIAPLAAPVVAPVTAPAPAATPALLSTSGPPMTQGLGQVRFGNSPEVNLISPHSYSSRPETISPSREYGAGGSGKHKDNEEEAKERLASATRDGFEPPFQALVYQPSVWENREGSKRSSPLPDEPVHPARMPLWGVRDEPVTSGVIDLDTARTLYTFFMNHCHPFLPIVDITLPDPFTSVQRYPSLFSAILAISARFYLRHSTTSHTIDSYVPAALADIAESHLAHTLLRKKHTLADVQAILLLAAWGLQSGGKGPDAWVLTGHAARVSRRLGIHRAVGQAVAATKRDGSQLEAPVDEVDAAVRRQWRTCFDSFLSFGFGRPQSTQFESIDDQAFLKARLSHPLPRPGTPASLSLYGDAYIAATARLGHIARSFVLWVEEQAPVGSPNGQSLLSMLSNLNGRLDDWCKLWVWSGSSHALYLGASARIARLQAEHLRLSINAMALRSSTHSDGHESSVTYLRKALNAAKSTIQTHFESSQTDIALSFATDYMTMAFAQAAVFLIRLTKASPLVQEVVSLDPAVVSHYLTMSVDLLELGDMSETRLSTYFARTIRGISRAAGLAIRPDDSTTTAGVAGDGLGDQPHVPEQSTSLVSADGAGDGGLYDADTFWAGHDPFDLSCVLGLSGGGVAQDTEWLEPALGNLGSFTQPTTPWWNMIFGTGEGSV
ncbi:hypothetical protein N7474_006253 [Penicillium riverlandense]|uniref:uncharacterized protein n=1 Tax=Penicillium riverlandense TaxID=1903569 RepID=UPI002547BB46|nr:uncharacterized protein N7474_006253 [Penicillium riverlandense]KAJ5814476.1 hypothetical protein N7474_006253 [Penicillium riverlandense]